MALDPKSIVERLRANGDNDAALIIELLMEDVAEYNKIEAAVWAWASFIKERRRFMRGLVQRQSNTLSLRDVTANYIEMIKLENELAKLVGVELDEGF